MKQWLRALETSSTQEKQQCRDIIAVSKVLRAVIDTHVLKYRTVNMSRKQGEWLQLKEELVASQAAQS